MNAPASSQANSFYAEIDPKYLSEIDNEIERIKTSPSIGRPFKGKRTSYRTWLASYYVIIYTDSPFYINYIFAQRQNWQNYVD